MIRLMNKVVIKIDPERIYARYSLLMGIIALFVCFTSVMDGMFEAFVTGAFAIVLSVCAKKDGRKPTGAKIGMALGILAVLVSSFMYYGYCMFYNYMKDPVAGPRFLELLEKSFQPYGISVDDFITMLRGR